MSSLTLVFYVLLIQSGPILRLHGRYGRQRACSVAHEEVFQLHRSDLKALFTEVVVSLQLHEQQEPRRY